MGTHHKYPLHILLDIKRHRNFIYTLSQPAHTFIFMENCKKLSLNHHQTPISLFLWKFSEIYEGHFRSNITALVNSLCMIQFSKTIPHFVWLYISYEMVKCERKNTCWAWRYSFIYTVGINTLGEKRTKYHNVLLIYWNKTLKYRQILCYCLEIILRY